MNKLDWRHPLIREYKRSPGDDWKRRSGCWLVRTIAASTQLLQQRVLQLCEKFHSSLQFSLSKPEEHLRNGDNVILTGVCCCSLKKRLGILTVYDTKKAPLGGRYAKDIFLCRPSSCWTEQSLVGSSRCSEGGETQEITKGDSARISQLAVHATSCNRFTKQMRRHAGRQTGLDANLKALFKRKN